MSTQTYILDFEGYQLDGKFYPVEIALVNCCTENYQMFYIAYPEMYGLLDSNLTIKCQFWRHLIPFNAPFAQYNLCQAKCELQNVIKSGDTVYVKGLQKQLFFRDWFHHSITINQFDEQPKIETLIQQMRMLSSSKENTSRRRCSAVHASSVGDDKFCALEKCFAMLHHLSSRCDTSFYKNYYWFAYN